MSGSHYFCILSVLLTTSSAIAESTETPTIDWSQPLTEQKALELAITNDPALKRIEVEADGADALVGQAGLRPNPTVGLEVENILGSGPRQGIDGMEITAGISQTIETAGKAGLRSQLAQNERALLDYERGIRLAELEAEVASAFEAVILAQEWQDLKNDRLSLEKERYSEISRLVEEARSPLFEKTRAELNVKQQEFALKQAERALDTAKTNLAAIWGMTEPIGFSVEGDLSTGDIPPLSELRSKLGQTAVMSRFDAQEDIRQAELRLEESMAKPDFEVFGGVRYYNEADGDVAFLVGVEVPWPVFNKNAGNIHNRRARLDAVRHERDKTTREALRVLVQEYQAMGNAHAEAKAIEEDLLPAAEKAMKATEEAFRNGRISQLEVIDSLRAVSEMREARLEALSRYRMARNRIRSITTPTISDR